jgi:hypothetical protein
MNEESLRRANAFLAAVAERVEPGQTLQGSPGEIGKLAGLPDALSAARAVRALLARRRLEVTEEGGYRLLDGRPVEQGEPEAVPRPPRKRKEKPAPDGDQTTAGAPGKTSFSEVGHVAIEKLIELGREVGQLRGSSRQAREEARQAREAREEAERRAQSLAARVKDLEGKLEMAESNLRTILAAAKGTGAAAKVAGDQVGDAEMEAILGVLRTNG